MVHKNIYLRLISLLLLLGSSSSFADLKKAQNIFENGKLGEQNLRSLIRELIHDEYYYSTIPWLKEYIAVRSGKLGNEFDDLLDDVITHVGLEQFEVMPSSMLERSNSSTIKFILAKKKVNNKEYKDAISIISSVSEESSIYPFALHLKATAASLSEDQGKAIDAFDDCVSASKKFLKDAKTDHKKRQLTMNRDYCVAGMARSLFAKRDYVKADLKYLDVPKESMVWPDILFEEAWNSFYLENYNRTLGKLVTYKAPVLDFIFNPETDVLRGYSYLKLCLWEDAKKTAEEFYGLYMEPAREVRLLLNEHKKDNEFFYKAGLTTSRDKTKNNLLNVMLVSVGRDPAYKDLKNALYEATDEYKKLKGSGSSKLKNAMLRNLAEVLTLQRNLFGGYVKRQLISKYANLYKSFQYMSYIKLEILDQKKAELYSNKEDDSDKRGDVKYIQRNDKQYFWNFNGEFWADELGDYVFALKSECKQ